MDARPLRQPSEALGRSIEGPDQKRRVVAALAGAMRLPSGMPLASTAIERLMPALPLSTGLLPAFSPPQGALVMQQSTAISESSRPMRRS